MATGGWFDPAVRLTAQTGIRGRVGRKGYCSTEFQSKSEETFWLVAMKRKDFDPAVDAAVCSEYCTGGILLQHQ